MKHSISMRPPARKSGASVSCLQDVLKALKLVQSPAHYTNSRWTQTQWIADALWSGPAPDEFHDAVRYALRGNLNCAIRCVELRLPGWWWRVGTCHLSDDACIGPDLNSPEHGERLKEAIGAFEAGSDWDTGFDVDRRPAGMLSLALMEALTMALIAAEGRGIDLPRGEP